MQYKKENRRCANIPGQGKSRNLDLEIQSRESLFNHVQQLKQTPWKNEKSFITIRCPYDEIVHPCVFDTEHDHDICFIKWW